MRGKTATDRLFSRSTGVSLSYVRVGRSCPEATPLCLTASRSAGGSGSASEACSAQVVPGCLRDARVYRLECEPAQ